MEDKIIEAVEKGIDLLVGEFQGNHDRYFNERDMHWHLFHYLKQQDILQGESANGLIRAEFPTRKKYSGKKLTRGHFDLVVLDPDSLADPHVAQMKPWDPWDEYLERVQVVVGIEVKMWPHRWSDRNLGELLGWDVKKLTDTDNGVKQPYLLNFIQFDFSKQHLKGFYRKLCDYLAEIAREHLKLKILCIPSDATQQIGPNWIR